MNRMKSFGNILILSLMVMNGVQCTTQTPLNRGASHERTESPQREYPVLAKKLLEITEENLFDPSLLLLDEFQSFKSQMLEQSKNVVSDGGFIDLFNELWEEGLFSHYDLRPSDKTALDFSNQVDQYRAGDGAVSLEIDDSSLAILRIQTMMGQDTIQAIDAAFDEILRQNILGLVVDLRDNGGGAFATQTLLLNLIGEPMDLGVFLGSGWYQVNEHVPNPTELRESHEPWSEMSVSGFWSGIQEEGVLWISDQSTRPVYTGPLVVLINQRTASAAEMAADGLRSRPNTVLMGAPSAGQMLSQAPFDLAPGLLLWVPIADYFSFSHGRIEGVGVPVDRTVGEQSALEVAKNFFLQ